jgi:hypothetical protein
VIVRYGECFRGLKVKNAQDRGAAGVLIYSDPIDDGFTKGQGMRGLCGISADTRTTRS